MPVEPVRLRDTRATGFLPPSLSVEQTLHREASSAPPLWISGAALNVTAVDPVDAGFLSTHPAGIPWPGNSNINIEHGGQTIAGLAVTPTQIDGEYAIRSSVATDVLIDFFGWFVG